MKREPKVTYQHGLEPHYTWFAWCECEKCNLEFRRENGFRFFWFDTKEMFLCGTCSQGDISWANAHMIWMHETYLSNQKPPLRPPEGR